MGSGSVSGVAVAVLVVSVLVVEVALESWHTVPLYLLPHLFRRCAKLLSFTCGDDTDAIKPR